MPDDKPEKQKSETRQKNKEMPEFDLKKLKIPQPPVTGSSWNLKSMKKPTYAFSLLLGLGGTAIALALLLVISDAIDNTEKEIAANLDGAYALFSDMESTAVSFESEIGALNSTLDGFNSSLSALAGGMKSTGLSIKDFGSSLSQIGVPGFSLGQQGAQLSLAGEELIEGADGLAEAAELGGHKNALGELKDSITSIRYDLGSQKAQIAQTKKSVGDVFGMVKLANFLVFLLFLTLFAVQILNSLAGVM